MTHLLTSALLAVFAIACGSADLITDPLIDRWCEGSPCAWETMGRTKKVGTWHKDDYAIELLSDGAQISQLNSQLDAEDSDCFAFSLIAKIEPRAHATLAVAPGALRCRDRDPREPSPPGDDTSPTREAGAQRPSGRGRGSIRGPSGGPSAAVAPPRAKRRRRGRGELDAALRSESSRSAASCSTSWTACTSWARSLWGAMTSR